MKNIDDSQTLWDRRDRLGIMAEIMEVAKDGQLKTRIMYLVNLSFSQVNEYLTFLTEKGFLTVITDDGKKRYETSNKGALYSENYKAMSNLVNPQEPAVESPLLAQ